MHDMKLTNPAHENNHPLPSKHINEKAEQIRFLYQNAIAGLIAKTGIARILSWAVWDRVSRSTFVFGITVLVTISTARRTGVS